MMEHAIVGTGGSVTKRRQKAQTVGMRLIESGFPSFRTRFALNSIGYSVGTSFCMEQKLRLSNRSLPVIIFNPSILLFIRVYFLFL